MRPILRTSHEQRRRSSAHNILQDHGHTLRGPSPAVGGAARPYGQHDYGGLQQVFPRTNDGDARKPALQTITDKRRYVLKSESRTNSLSEEGESHDIHSSQRLEKQPTKRDSHVTRRLSHGAVQWSSTRSGSRDGIIVEADRRVPWRVGGIMLVILAIVVSAIGFSFYMRRFI